MAKIRFCYVNRFSATAAALTASSAVSALPVNAAKNPDRSYVWRSSTGTGEQTIDVDLGGIYTVDAIAMANVKLLGAAGALDVYERGLAGAPGAATLLSTMPAQDRDRRVTFVFPASASRRHLQLKWTNPGAVSDYAELGHCFVGTYVEPATNVLARLPWERADVSVASASVDGQKDFARRTKYAAGAWRWEAIADAVHDELRLLFDTIGLGGRHYVVLDTTRAWTAVYAQLTSALKTDFGVVDGRYDATIAWEEVR